LARAVLPQIPEGAALPGLPDYISRYQHEKNPGMLAILICCHFWKILT
jgi:hypothetical protein